MLGKAGRKTKQPAISFMSYTKGKFVLCTLWGHMRRAAIWTYSLLTSARGESEQSASFPGLFSLR